MVGGKMKFKVGDKVKCVKTSFTSGNPRFYPGYCFTISKIKKAKNSNADKFYLYNKKNQGCGDSDVIKIGGSMEIGDTVVTYGGYEAEIIEKVNSYRVRYPNGSTGVYEESELKPRQTEIDKLRAEIEKHKSHGEYLEKRLEELE